MSIIYEALKKVEATRSNEPQPQSHPKPKPQKLSKHRLKLYFVFLLVVCSGIFIANIILGMFGAPPGLKKQTSPVISKVETTSLVKTAPPELSIPLVPVAPHEPLKVKEDPRADLVLTGVFFSGDEGYALINNRIVKEGDNILGAVVRKITLNEVELEFQGSSIKLPNSKQ